MAMDPLSDRAITERPVDTREPSQDAKDVVEEARRRAEESYNARRAFRAQMEADREFLQSQFTPRQRAWNEEVGRPQIEIHAVHARIQQVMHDYRQAGLGFRVGSATGDGTDNEARIFNGLAQRDQKRSGADGVLHDVVSDCVSLGEGWGKWEVVNARDRARPVPGERIFDGRQWSLKAAIGMRDRDLRMAYCVPEHVYPDPHSRDKGRSDMEWLIETYWITYEQRREQFPGAADLPMDSFDAPAEQDGIRWFDGRQGAAERDQRVLIANYWRVTWEEMDYAWFPGEEDGIRADSLTPEQEAARENADIEVVVEKEIAPVLDLFVVDGRTVLAGPIRQPYLRIPYFRCVASEKRHTDGEVVPYGQVYLLRGPSKWATVTATDLAWKQSTIGLGFFVADPESIAGYEQDWADKANPTLIRRVNQYADTADAVERQYTPPQFVQPKPDILDNMQAIGMIRDIIGMVSGAADAQQRETALTNPSAVALDKMDKLAAANRSDALNNAEQVMIAALGEEWLKMAPAVYGRAGRRIVVGSENPGDPDEGVIVGVPFARVDGKVIPLPGLADDVNEVPVAEGATARVHRFDPKTADVKVTTYSSGMTRAGADAKAQLISANMLPQAPPEGPLRLLLMKSMASAISDVVPLDDVVAALDKQIPPDEGDTDVGTLAARLADEQRKTAELEERLKEAAAAADQVSAAKEIEDLRAQSKMAVAELTSALKATTAEAIAELRAEVDRERIEFDREKMIVEAAAKSDEQDRKAEADAALAGAQAALKQGAENDGG